MKLKNSDRECIVARIMNDVPSVNYTEQAHQLVKDHFKNLLPPAILKALADPKLNKHIAKTQIYIEGFSNVYINGGFCEGGSYAAYPPEDVKSKISELGKLNIAQRDKLREIERKLKVAFAGVNTRKQALQLFPEFEKYLPEEYEKLRNLPVTTDVMPTLIGMGWPKGKKLKVGKENSNG